MAFFSATLVGVQPIPVEIEIDLSEGLPFFQIVGLPDAILKESKTRVKSAIMQSGYDFPYTQRVVLNLAPSKVKKEGTGFELGLAARILATSNQIPAPDFNILFLGELALDGSVRSVPEIEALSFVAHPAFSRGLKIDLVVVASENVQAISHLGLPVFGIRHLQELKGVCWWINGQVPERRLVRRHSENVFSRLRFTKFWARHLLIAAVGGHHYFLCGPPGCGKTFFAESLQMLLANLLRSRNPEADLLNAVFGRKEGELPWAAPHHSASMAGLVGGGNPPRAGALTRAHGGILFLDELLEFSPSTIDALREPLEKGKVEIFRAGSHVIFPTRFQIVAATNPCRCGHYKNIYSRCTCLPKTRLQYQSKLSGPFFDRFDVRILCLPSEKNEELVQGLDIESLAAKIKKENISVDWNSRAHEILNDFTEKKHLNYRAHEKTKALAVTLARIDGQSTVQRKQIQEAVNLHVFKGLATVR
jgi:magnesium chelatase family protein